MLWAFLYLATEGERKRVYGSGNASENIDAIRDDFDQILDYIINKNIECEEDTEMVITLKSSGLMMDFDQSDSTT